MIRLARLGSIALALLGVMVLDGCRRRPAPEPGPAVNQDSISRERARQDSIAAAERARLAEQRRQDSIRLANEANAMSQADMMAALSAIIYFDYDESALRGDAIARLDAKLPILLANPGVNLRIAGHTDERGSSEYNLALGQRRAAAAKRYLVERGVGESRITTISYGEERPVAEGADESAWSQNRRAEFEITAGGGVLRRPGQ